MLLAKLPKRPVIAICAFSGLTCKECTLCSDIAKTEIADSFNIGQNEEHNDGPDY